MSRRMITSVGVLLALPLAAMSADGAEDGRALLHPSGMSLAIGGGVNAFTGERMGGLTEPGASWDIRFVVGTRETVGLELGYVGTARRVHGPGDEVTLASSGLEAALRLHIADGIWQPYFLVGVAWKRYHVDEGAETMFAVRSDDVIETPLGLGLTLRRNVVVVDARASYRAASRADIVVAVPGERRPLDNYDVTLHIGFEF